MGDVAQFAASIRAKYPGSYDAMSDGDLVSGVLKKYPQYASRVDNPAAAVLNKSVPVPEGLQGTNEPPTMGFSKYPSASDALAADVNSLPQNFVGTAKELGRTAYGAGSLVNKAITGETNTDIDYPDALQPKNQDQVNGMRNTAAAEMFAPGMGAAKLTKLWQAPAIVEAALNAAGTLALSKAQSGKTPGALETGVAVGAPMLGAAAESAAPSLVNRVLRPRGKELSFGRNPGQGVVDEGIVSASKEGLQNKVQDAMSSVGSDIDNVVAPHTNTADVRQTVFQPVVDAYNKANSLPRTNKGLIDELQNYGLDLSQKPLDQMTPSGILGLKRDIAGATRWTGSGFDKDVNQAKVGGFGGLKNKLNAMVPEVAPLNERYANLVGANNALDRQALAAPPLAPWMEAGGLGAGLASGFAGGNDGNSYNVGRGLGGAALLTGLAALTRNPGVATFTAQAMRRAPAIIEAGKNIGLGAANTPSVPTSGYTLMTAPDGSLQHVPSDKVMEALGKQWQVAR